MGLLQRATQGLAPHRDHPKLPRLCPPGHHRWAEHVGTVKGKRVATAVVCEGCRRTPSQVMRESPADAALYAAWQARNP